MRRLANYFGVNGLEILLRDVDCALPKQGTLTANQKKELNDALDQLGLPECKLPPNYTTLEETQGNAVPG